MTLLRRALIILLAYVVAAAFGAAAIAISTYVLTLTNPAMAGMPWPTFSRGIEIIVRTAPVVFVPMTAAAFIPAMIVAAVGETFQLRSVLFYAATGGAVAVIAMIAIRLMLYFTMFRPKLPAQGIGLSFSIPWFIVAAGIISGLVYWAIAGRNAGKWRAMSAKA
jgi:hypothetical protein